MNEIILNFDNKIDKIKSDFNLIKEEIKIQNISYLEDLVVLNNNLDTIIENLLNIKTDIFKNDLEKLDFLDQKEINQQLIENKVNQIIKPLMLSLLLKYS